MPAVAAYRHSVCFILSYPKPDMRSLRLFLARLRCSRFANRGANGFLLAAFLLIASTVQTRAQATNFFLFTSNNYPVSEGEGTATITVTRISPWGAAMVDVVVTNGTASNNVNFSALATNTLVFSNFQQSASFDIQLTENTRPGTNGPSVQATLILANPRAITNTIDPRLNTIQTAIATLNPTANLTIIDNDVPLQFNFKKVNYTVAEGSSVDVEVAMNPPVPADGELQELEVDYEILRRTDLETAAGSDFASEDDFVAESGTLSFAPDETSKTITVQTLADSELEFNEDFFVVLKAARGKQVIQPASTDGGGGAAAATDGGGTGEPTENPFVLGPLSTARVTIIESYSNAPKPAGSLDLTFNADNSETTTPPQNRNPGANNVVYAVAPVADGGSFIAGEFTSVDGIPRGRVARLNAQGEVDQNFKPLTGANDYVNALAVYTQGPDAGKVLIGGGFTSVNGVQRNGIARLNPDGSTDPTFFPIQGADGPIYAIAIQLDGSILIGGDFTSYDGIFVTRIARLLPDGQLDQSFDPGFGPNEAVFAIVNETVDAVTVVERDSGTEPERFSRVVDLPGTAGTVSFNFHFFGGTNEFAIRQGNQLVYLSGITNHQSLVVTNQDGTTVTNFVPTTGTVSFSGNTPALEFIINNTGDTNLSSNWIFSATIQASTAVGTYIGGEFTAYDGVEVGHFARVSPNGSLDAAFASNTGIGADSTVYSLARQGTGHIVLGGAFQSFNSFDSRGVARVNPDGRYDRNFAVGSGANDAVYSVVTQGDNKILIGGSFWQYNSSRRVFVARLFPEGSLDTSFMDPAYNQYAGFPGTNWLVPEGYVRTVALDQSGGVLVGGLFSRVGGGNSRTDIHPRANFARLNGGATPGPGNISFDDRTFGGDENGGGVQMLVGRTNGTLGAILVTMNFEDGAALHDVDYTATPQDIIWDIAGPQQADGEDIDYAALVPVLDDDEIEGDEDFNAELLLPEGLLVLGGEFIGVEPALGNIYKAKALILENDVEPSFVALSQDEYDFNENDGTVTISVTRTGSTSRSATVRYASTLFLGDTNAVAATENVDYFPASGTISFASGQTNKTFTLRLRDDATVEKDETFAVQLFSPSPGLVLGTNKFGTNGIYRVRRRRRP